MPKALLSVGGRPAIFHWLTPMIRAGVREFCLVVNPAHRASISSVVNSCLGGAKVSVRYIEQQWPAGPGDAFSLCETLLHGPTLLTLADTICSVPAVRDRDWLGVAPFPRGTHERWCTVVVDDRGNARQLIDKPQTVPPTDRAAVGIYYFTDAAALRTAIRKARASHQDAGEFQLSLILDQYISQRSMAALDIEGWIDLGTLGDYQRAVRHLLPARAFNQLRVSDNGYVVKRASDAAVTAIRDEVRWYQEVPASTRRLAPRLIGSDAQFQSYRTEYIDYPSLAELLTYTTLPDDAWVLIFDQLVGQLEVSLWRRPVHAIDMVDLCRRMYVEKTSMRLSQWHRRDLVEADCIIVNDQPTQGFRRLWAAAKGRLERLVTSGNRYSSVIHGDLSFGNILYSTRSGVFRLVDPRGNFGVSGSTGDLRYDGAKLRQCYHGHYDALAEDLFSVAELEPRSFELTLFPTQWPDPTPFDSRLRLAGLEVTDLQLIEALLLLSLLPAHYESPDRQLACFLLGLQALGNALEED